MVVSSFLELGLDKESAERVLERAYEVGALLQGEFTLASGKKSDHYFEGKMLTLDQDGGYWVAKTVLDELANADVDAVGGLATGAFPIVSKVSEVARQEGRPIRAFVVRRMRKKHGTRRKIEGHLQEGWRVVIVDDVITTGGSVSRAIKAVEALKCKVVKIIVIVDRHEGGSDKLKKKGYDFSAIINLWPSGEVTVGESSAATGETKERVLR